MLNMTLEQLRATALAGGVVSVTLKGEGSGFLMQIATRSGQDGFLVKARSTEPRRFGSPNSAMIVLREMGIVIAQLDTTNWNPDQKEVTQNRDNRAQAMRQAHEAAAYNQWLVNEIQASIDDPRPNLSHDKVMAEMNVELSASTKKKRA
jgi:hypothetical protein